MIKKLFWGISKKHYSLNKSIHELKNVGIEITNRCNLKCKHCYMNSVDCEDEELSTEEWLNFIKKLKKDFGEKVLLQFTGGEPLVRKDIFEILELCKKLNFKTTITSNGILLDKTNIEKLSKYVSSFSVSLDGLKNNHNLIRNNDCFDSVLNNIKQIKKFSKKYLTIKTSINKNNFSNIRNIYNLINNLEIDSWHVFAMEPIGRGAKNKNLILSKDEYWELCEIVDQIKSDQGRKVRIVFEEEGSNFMYSKTRDYCKYKLCSAGISSCSILYNGDIVKCIQDDRNNIFKEGNVLHDNFKEVWENKFLISRGRDYTSCNNHHFYKK